MPEQKRKAKTPEEVAEITGGDVHEIAAAFNAVRIIRDDEEPDE
jgi:hypothetical protein